MGQEIARTVFSADDFQRFHGALAEETRQLAAFARDGGFMDPRYVVGFELEAWLLDHAGLPNPINQPFLKALHDPLVVPELSRFNVEINGPPQEMGPGALSALEYSLRATWARCQDTAHAMDTMLAMIGILPTIRDEDLGLANLSAQNRYVALNQQVQRQRAGEPICIDIDGMDPLRIKRPDVMLEAATTSFQVHLQVPYHQAGRHYNAALIASAPVLAASTNSPLLFGHRLWRETRIPLFEQSVELGGYGGLADRTVRRVTFGRSYVDRDLMDLFLENLTLYPVLLPMGQLSTGQNYPHLRLHNGCIWRWVRPLLGFDADGLPHVRIEQRVLPSGPTILDMMANAAFHFGLTHALASSPRAPERELAFVDASANFYRAAREGLDARLVWLDGRSYPAPELIQAWCLPLARQGLADLGLESAEVERYLDVLAARVASGQTGAEWQLGRLARERGDVARMMEVYLHNQRADLPVHEWDVREDPC